MENDNQINEIDDTEVVIDEKSQEALERVGEVISKIEMTKQQTALAQIKATSEDNKRQYDFAVLQAKNANDRWNKSLMVGVVAVAVLMLTSIYLIITGDKAVGLGLLSSTITGVFGYLAGVGSSR